MQPHHHHHHHDSSRRSFLSQALGVSALGTGLLEQAFFRAAQARAQMPSSPRNALFDIQKVADNVYAAIARPQPILNSNAVIFENANDLLIVDAHSKPSAAAALAVQIKKEVTDKPIRYIVNTHFHWDHTQGDAAYKQVAPNAEFVASTTTRNLLAKFGSMRAKESVDEAAVSLDKCRQQLDAAKKKDDQLRLEQTITELKSYIAEMQNYSPELPDVTFDRSLVLHDKAHDLELAFQGRGHTAGDVVVFCPQSKVVATGDLLHGWFPNIADGYPREWPATLASIGKLPFDIVVGGHGGVQQGRKRLGQMSSYIAELTQVVEAGKRRGKTLPELQALILPSKLRSLDEDYKTFLVSQTNDKISTPEAIVADSVKSNIESVFSRLNPE